MVDGQMVEHMHVQEYIRTHVIKVSCDLPK